MGEDFFYALLIGWFILALFWGTIIIFIAIRRPPTSKLTAGLILKSASIFIFILFVIYLFK